MNLPIFLIAISTLSTVSFLLNYLLLKWTRTLGTKNQGEDVQVRWSETHKPAIGGVSFYIIFLISYLTYLFLAKPEVEAQQSTTQFAILISVTLGFFTGLADDAFNTVPWLKFSAQLSCGVLLVLFGIQIEFFNIPWADAMLTVFWTVSVMNSINMLDNMDGVTGSVTICILAAAGLCAFPITDSNLFFTFICGGTMAAVFGFLFFNWHPSKMFMGDTGSQMLGALLASIGITFFWNNSSLVPDHSWISKLIVVSTAFVVPIADSLTVTINRIARGQSPFVGGRDHTTHHLSYAGLSDEKVAFIMAVLSAISVLLIGLLKFIPESELKAYMLVMGLFSFLVIVFLYSTTLWKKPRSTFRSRNLNHVKT
ncbi:MAG: MraY family glycosyltransferase [Flavobacteriales bacterium]